jgi:hypothetical protein
MITTLFHERSTIFLHCGKCSYINMDLLWREAPDTAFWEQLSSPAVCLSCPIEIKKSSENVKEKDKCSHQMCTVPQLIRIMLRLQAWEVDKFFTSGMMNVASLLSLFPNSLNEVSKQTRLNRYIGVCCKTISRTRMRLVDWQSFKRIIHCTNKKRGYTYPFKRDVTCRSG